jgi:RNA polymerase sigma-70 factor (ECF subfamily)
MRNGDGVWREIHFRDAVLAGNADAWRTWYEQSYEPLARYVHWRCAQLHDLADDVIQETWLTAIRRIGRFRPEEADFLSWLRGIAANVIRNQFRGRRRLLGRQQPLMSEPSSNGTAHTTEDDRERSERIALALAALPDHYEAVLRAKYLDQLPVDRIAEQRGESPKAVESTLTRARAAFREAYAQQEAFQ